MLYEGYAIPPFYDSLLGKLIVHGADRDAAMDALAAALNEIRIEGLKTTLPLFRALVRDTGIRAGEATTSYLETWLDSHTIDAA
jgi:acetyl-CoA carboxylase biotin carboxylase subunit